MEVITIESAAYQVLVQKLEQVYEFFRSFSQAEELKESTANTSYFVQSTSKEVWLSMRAAENKRLHTVPAEKRRVDRVAGITVSNRATWKV